MAKDVYTLGVVWDTYTPAVEGQLTRDIIAMRSLGPCTNEFYVVTPDASADRLLAALGVTKGIAPALARLWITYRTGAERVYAPEHATQVVDRDLHVDVADISIDPTSRPGYYLKEPGRYIAPSLNLNKPPPAHSGPTDPIVVLLWS